MTAFDGVLIGAVIACLICAIQIFPNGKEYQKRSFFITSLCVLIIAILVICIAAFKFQWPSEILDIPPDETASPTTEATASEPTIPDNVRIGDTIPLGTYEQDNDLSNGKEAIEWLVLEKEGDKILVLSKLGLDSDLFNRTYKPVTWETCTIRDWCKGFYDDAFTSEEQESILLSTLQPGTCPAEDCDKGNATEDHVFLLSLDEVTAYVKENGQLDPDALLCRPTEYAVQEAGAYKNGTGHGWWWLRTSTNNNCYACSVNSDGTIDLSKGTVTSPNAAIRPAMWLQISEEG